MILSNDNSSGMPRGLAGIDLKAIGPSSDDPVRSELIDPADPDEREEVDTKSGRW
jgi:hypothetical protein